MPPVACHDKFVYGLACPGRHFAILQGLGQRSRVSWVTDGDRGNGFPSRRNPKDVPRFFRVKSGHLMDG